MFEPGGPLTVRRRPLGQKCESPMHVVTLNLDAGDAAALRGAVLAALADCRCRRAGADHRCTACAALRVIAVDLERILARRAAAGTTAGEPSGRLATGPRLPSPGRGTRRPMAPRRQRRLWLVPPAVGDG